MQTPVHSSWEFVIAALKNPRLIGVETCCLCGSRKVPISALYAPADDAGAKMIGQPEGKQRFILYALCSKCADLPDRAERVEATVVWALSARESVQ
jgi:hypothetical protein